MKRIAGLILARSPWPLAFEPRRPGRRRSRRRRPGHHPVADRRPDRRLPARRRRRRLRLRLADHPAIFPTVDIFMAMVRTGYQPVYRPQSVTFGPLVETAAGPIQRVFITGPDGQSYVAVYSLSASPTARGRSTAARSSRTTARRSEPPFVPRAVPHVSDARGCGTSLVEQTRLRVGSASPRATCWTSREDLPLPEMGRIKEGGLSMRRDIPPRPALLRLGNEVGVAPGGDRGADAGHQALVVGEVVPASAASPPSISPDLTRWCR